MVRATGMAIGPPTVDTSEANATQRWQAPRRRNGEGVPQQPPPLAGIRVIDYSHFLAGPYLGRCLAALGADVIKVERPKTGDAGRAHAYFAGGQSGYFLQQNMGKRGLCVDVKDERGRAFLHR